MTLDQLQTSYVFLVLAVIVLQFVIVLLMVRVSNLRKMIDQKEFAQEFYQGPQGIAGKCECEERVKRIEHELFDKGRVK